MKPAPLTREEKIAGRMFRTGAQSRAQQRADGIWDRALAEERDRYMVPNFLAQIRHECSRRGGRSTALDLREVYEYSPVYYVWEMGDRDQTIACSLTPPDNVAREVTVIPAGRFGFITKEGKCACGAVAVSRAGRFVDAYQRAPLEGRVAR